MSYLIDVFCFTSTSSNHKNKMKCITAFAKPSAVSHVPHYHLKTSKNVLTSLVKLLHFLTLFLLITPFPSHWILGVPWLAVNLCKDNKSPQCVRVCLCVSTCSKCKASEKMKLRVRYFSHLLCFLFGESHWLLQESESNYRHSSSSSTSSLLQSSHLLLS